MIATIAAIAVAVTVHLGGMAVAARMLGIGVRSITLGLGPVLFHIGWLRFGLLPFGGHVRLTSIADLAATEQPGHALDAQPRWKRVALPLSGPLVLLALGATLTGAAAWPRFRAGFVQWLGGAADPFGHAHALLDALAGRAAGPEFGALVGLVACKLAAMNLLPFAGSNSVQAVRGLLPPALPDNGREGRITVVLALVPMLLFAGWALAVASWLLPLA